MFKYLVKILCFILSFFNVNAFAQTTVSPKDSLKKASVLKSFKMGALLVSDYRASLTTDVDMYGQHNSQGVASYDGFFLRYIRLSGNYKLNERLGAAILVNLADFKNLPQTRVLENAFVTYKFSNYAMLYVGQFRPFFGLEDMYPYDFRRSYIWSNQYEEFGRNGWQSFQLGVAMTGSLKDKGIPINYYLSIVNGNGKNMIGDNDRNKDITWRLEYLFGKYLKVGINSGLSRYDHQNANAYGVDVQSDVDLSSKWSISMDAEYKSGSNFLEYVASAVPEKRLEEYRSEGIYTTPAVTYRLNRPHIKSIELSSRYELFEQLTQKDNPRTTITPVVGIFLADDYAAKLSFGVMLDRYRHQTTDTRRWNSGIFFTQFQFKF